jgi:LPS export ABC transporter protein LptC
VTVRTERKRRPATAALPWLLLCAAFCLGCSQGEDPPAPTTVAEGEAAGPPPDQVLFDATITDTTEGDRRWILDSERLEKQTKSDMAELYTVHMDFYKADTLYSTLTSERGRANLKTKLLHAWGNVVVVTRDGRRLETEELTYDNARGRIHNEVFNRFTRGEDVMTGIGMEATPELDYFELKNEVAADVSGDGRDGPSEAPPESGEAQ